MSKTPVLNYVPVGSLIPLRRETPTVLPGVADFHVPVSLFLAPVYARYTQGDAQSIPNGGATVVDFNVKVYDTHSAVIVGRVASSLWRFIAPVKGLYAVSASILFVSTTTWADADNAQLTAYKNGGGYSVLDRKDSYGSASSVYMGLGGVDIMELEVGESLSAYVYQNSGGALAIYGDSGYNYISIWRVG
jgi:hypothetical protein